MLISEFLPNPIGKDTDGEWIELFNDKNKPINLTGWKLKDASGKTLTIKNTNLEPFGYLVLDYKTTKITLNNNAETLFLYNPAGNLIDKAEFNDNAKSGLSLIRPESGGDKFVFTAKPTPGKPNIFEAVKTAGAAQNKNFETGAAANNFNNLGKSNYPANISGSDFGNILIGVFIALALAGIFILIYKKLNLSREN
jgi:hypothetical protein